MAAAVAAYLTLNPPPPLEVVGAPSGVEVATLIGGADEPAVVERCQQVGEVIALFARQYTRGNGFYAEGVAQDIGSVILTASARLAANPEQLYTQVGGVITGAGFQGWTLAEQIVLNQYRKVAS